MAIELGEIFLPYFLKGVKACAFLELLFCICFAWYVAMALDNFIPKEK